MIYHRGDHFRRHAEIFQIDHVLCRKVIAVLRVGHKSEDDIFGHAGAGQFYHLGCSRRDIRRSRCNGLSFGGCSGRSILRRGHVSALRGWRRGSLRATGIQHQIYCGEQTQPKFCFHIVFNVMPVLH